LSLAAGQLAGGLSRAVSAVRQEILPVFAHLEATIDFAEDDVPPPASEDLLQALAHAQVRLDGLLATARAGQVHREGIRIAIVGKPNAGKSSLLNALLQTDRAIVTPVPGTTRDVIEETLDLGGVPATLVDTAGITETDDPVERIGVDRSRNALAVADVILLVLDTSTPLAGADREITRLIQEHQGSGAAIVVLSKADLPPCVTLQEAAALLPDVPRVRISSLTGEGLGSLRDTLRRAALGEAGVQALASGESVVTNARHRDALERARQALAEAMRSVEADLPADFVCIDLRASLAALGEISGESVTEDVLAHIFSEFCIGK
ncbi:MAG: tRNA modification GTPase, partial [Chloroflexota bacterium]